MEILPLLPELRREDEGEIMYKYNNLVGNKYGMLSVVKEGGRTADRHILWECLCDCGRNTFVSSKDLTSGHTKSCGCMAGKHKNGSKSKMNPIRLYRVWREMKRRCYDTECKSFKYYGLKGVSVCDEWNDFENFKNWSFTNGYDVSAKYGVCTLDRINPYGNYEPTNCRWVSMKVQNENKRTCNSRMEQEGER